VTTTQTTERTELVSAALAAAAPQFRTAGSSHWQIPVRNGMARVIAARTAGQWLILESDFGAGTPGSADFLQAFKRNASLPGFAKIALTPGGQLNLRAEIPVVEDGDLTARIREVLDGFAAAWSADELPGVKVATADITSELADLKPLCTEAGWPFTERGGGRLAVELEAPAGFYQALLTPLNGGVRVACELAPLESDSENARRASAVLLLAASGLVRLARAAVNADQTPPVARFEVVFGTAPSPSELSSALECLSVACSHCGEEVKLLQAPAIAERFLALRGWNAEANNRRNERTVTK